MVETTDAMDETEAVNNGRGAVKVAIAVGANAATAETSEAAIALRSRRRQQQQTQQTHKRGEVTERRNECSLDGGCRGYSGSSGSIGAAGESVGKRKDDQFPVCNGSL